MVTLEMCRFFQGKFMQSDHLMYDKTKDMNMKVLSSNLNEEIGRVSYVFSDKTGTLTQNVMEFKRFSAGMETYGSMAQSNVVYQPGVTNVNFSCERFDRDWTKAI